MAILNRESAEHFIKTDRKPRNTAIYSQAFPRDEPEEAYVIVRNYEYNGIGIEAVVLDDTGLISYKTVRISALALWELANMEKTFEDFLKEIVE